MSILAIDPGKRIGWAVHHAYDPAWPDTEWDRGVLDKAGLWSRLEFEKGRSLFWDNAPIDAIVCEDFIGRPGQKNGGQHFDAAEIIGMLEYCAYMSGIPFFRQRPVDVIGSLANPGPAVLWSGYKQTAKHLPDQDSAYLHGFYYLVKIGVLKPVPLVG